jgi:hypothetical protein
VKTIELRQWNPEGINSPEENEILIKDIVQALAGQEPGTNTVSVGGDTLLFGAVDSEGQLCIYECTIRRASVNVVVDIVPDGCVGTRQGAAQLLS